MSITVTWLGNASFHVKLNNQLDFYIDPWIKENPGCPVETDQIIRSDYVFVTHGHPGHFGRGDSVEIANNTNAVYVTSDTLAKYLLETKALPGEKIVGMIPGETRNFSNSLSVSYYAAKHPYHPPVKPPWDELPGEPNGLFVFNYNNKTFMHVGDALPDPIFEEIYNKHSIDLAMLPLWGKGMGLEIDEAVSNVINILRSLKPLNLFLHNRYEEYNPAFDKVLKEIHNQNISVKLYPQVMGTSIIL